MGVRPPRASVKVRRGVGPGLPGLLLPPPGHRARPAAIARPWVTAWRPQGSGRREGVGNLSPRPITPFGAGIAETKTEKLRPHRRTANSPSPAEPRVYTRRDCACAAVLPPGRGGASCDRPQLWVGLGRPWRGRAPRAGRGQGGPGSALAVFSS